jgi:uncharacterized protein (TIRG00374 family)
LASRLSKTLWTLVRLAVCVGLLIVVIRGINWNDFRKVISNLDLGLAALALVVFAPAPLLLSLRLVWMLRVQDIRISYWLAVKLSFAGNLLNFVVLGSIGGDLYKAYYLTKHTQSKTEAVTTILVDRIVGLTSLILLVAVVTLVSYRNPLIGQLVVLGPLKLGPAIGLMLLAFVVGALTYFNPWLRRVLHIGQLVDRLPLSHLFRQADEAVHQFHRRPGWVIGSYALTFVLQFSAICSAYVAALALGMEATFVPYLVYVPLGFLVWSVPITFGGLGTMDVYYQKFFPQAGLGNVQQAFCLAMFVRLTQLIWSLPGILVPLTGAHLPSKETVAQFQKDE